jgi:hypothetical protein
MKIAGEFEAKQWPGLRERLNAGDVSAWNKAIVVVRDRIEGRYLKQARRIMDYPYSAFAVLTIDSAVIETLEQFRRGLSETPPGKSGEFFKVFLTTTRLKKYFNVDRAHLFYTTVRCGLLHQGETKSDSRVTRKPFVVRRSRTGKGIRVNARRLHEELEATFEEYVAALLKGDRDLRDAFVTKMGYIARSKPDTAVV